MIRDSEGRLLEKVDSIDQSNDLRMTSQHQDFLHEVKDLKLVTKERHVLFVQEVKKVREDVNLQIRELHEDMQKEFQVVQQDYASMNQKIDIIYDAVTRFAKLFKRVQGGETKLDFMKGGEHSKVEVKKISAAKPIVVSAGPVSSTVVTTAPLTKPILKGVVISEAGGSASKTKTVVTKTASKDKGKGILIEKTKEEKKAEVEAEVEKMRHLQSIMTLRA
ncbi:unnamed protein product [Lactuca saligna]|uniref:Uncharacterized protein n=1 Tax=Lactuca saligna TaxID=75948 RepID=A0AA36E429_LACSI|nr:unnamed protein product [Lactuca saligna]